MSTTLINLHETKIFDFKIDRTSLFGNPHNIGLCKVCNVVHTREQAVSAYKNDFYKRLLTDQEFRDKVSGLKDKVLGCWCIPLLCHGMVILEYLEGIPYEKRTDTKTTDFFG